VIAFKNNLDDASPSLRTAAVVVGPLVELLRQLGEVIDSFSDEQYLRKSVCGVANSAGAHVRHSLDHIEALLDGARTGVVDYEHRRRDLDVAGDRSAARMLIRQLVQRLLAEPVPVLRPALHVSVVLNSLGEAVNVATNFERELAFVLSHTIHHNSLIAVVATALGVPLPQYFGYAPATIARLEKTRCVR
jgi:hypothetical protein